MYGGPGNGALINYRWKWSPRPSKTPNPNVSRFTNKCLDIKCPAKRIWDGMRWLAEGRSASITKLCYQEIRLRIEGQTIELHQIVMVNLRNNTCPLDPMGSHTPKKPKKYQSSLRSLCLHHHEKPDTSSIPADLYELILQPCSFSRHRKLNLSILFYLLGPSAIS